MKKAKRKRKTHLQKNGLPVQLLAACASGALSISSGLITTAAKGSRLPSQRKWLHEYAGTLKQYTKADFERMFEDAEQRRRIVTALDRLKRRRLLRVVRRGGQEFLVVTKEGKQKLVSVLLGGVEAIPTPATWDKKWRVVLYDIPETHRAGRDALRERLQQLGFFQLQKSAFVFPYPCTDVLDAVVHAFNLRAYTTIFTAQDLGYHEPKALKHFGLLP